MPGSKLYMLDLTTFGERADCAENQEPVRSAAAAHEPGADGVAGMIRESCRLGIRSRGVVAGVGAGARS